MQGPLPKVISTSGFLTFSGGIEMEHWPEKIRWNTAQNMKFSIKDFFSECDQIRSFLLWNKQLWYLTSLSNNSNFHVSNFHRLSSSALTKNMKRGQEGKVCFTHGFVVFRIHILMWFIRERFVWSWKSLSSLHLILTLKMTNITEYYLNFNERWHRCIFSQFYLLKKESGKVSYMTNITDNVTITITQLPNMRGISFLFNTIVAIVLTSHRVHETPV